MATCKALRPDQTLVHLHSERSWELGLLESQTQTLLLATVRQIGVLQVQLDLLPLETCSQALF